MPPEAINNSAANDPRSDLYAVGAIGYFLLTGKCVFDDEDIMEAAEGQLAATPVPPSWRTKNKISVELEKTILRCLERDPERRPQSALELRALLLASPRAADFTPEARAAWWAEFHGQKQAAVEVKTATPSPLPTVKIDLLDGPREARGHRKCCNSRRARIVPTAVYVHGGTLRVTRRDRPQSARGQAQSRTLRVVRGLPVWRVSVLDCGGPPPLSPAAFQC